MVRLTKEFKIVLRDCQNFVLFILPYEIHDDYFVAQNVNNKL